MPWWPWLPDVVTCSLSYLDGFLWLQLYYQLSMDYL